MMETIEFELAHRTTTDYIHGDSGTCLTKCPKGIDVKVGSVACQECVHFVSMKHSSIVCNYEARSANRQVSLNGLLRRNDE